MKTAVNTFLLVDKPAGWTSFDVCAKLRKSLNIKRIGHTGTLDPFATGLLVVAVGKCTKLIPLLEKDRKTYRATTLLGKTSETLDPESEIVEVLRDQGKEESLSAQRVQEFLNENFLGKIEQIPPQYSALKINGQRAYDLARKGETVEMKPRQTEVFSCKVLGYRFPELELELSVAAGFYVRSFARDVGTALAGGGLCSQLRRIGVGEVSINNDQLSIRGQRMEQQILDITKIENSDLKLENYFIDSQLLIKNIVHLEVPSARLPDLQAGRALVLARMEVSSREDLENGQKVLLLCKGETVGLAEIIEGSLQPRIVF